MNQRFSSQGLTRIVGATLAVALVKHESGFERTATDKQAFARTEASKRCQKITVQNATELQLISITKPLEGD